MIPSIPDARLVGYARVSTGSQDLDLQLDALEKCGVAKELIFTDNRFLDGDHVRTLCTGTERDKDVCRPQ